uniref:Uncharacterized protein n=1 Tax=Amphimedon queenslandica TaxID=400682 RepID=A0A1X7TPC2_AMPQE
MALQSLANNIVKTLVCAILIRPLMVRPLQLDISKGLPNTRSTMAVFLSITLGVKKSIYFSL